LSRLFQGVRPFYFVTFTTYHRQRLLSRPEIHQTFREFALNARSFNVAVGRYVLMPDHLHLFVALSDEGVSLISWAKALKSVISRRLQALGETRPYWQEGFFDHVLRSDESYDQKWEYVRMNPVRAGQVSVPEEWPYQGEIVQIRF